MRGRGSTTSRHFIIALGGNAIIPGARGGSYEEQRRLTRRIADQIAELAARGHRLVLTHGNGPVVGNIVLRNEAGFQLHGIARMPLYICGADSQGGLGYMIQQGMQNALRAKGLRIPVVSLVTQVEVAADDPAFARPSKPIGPFYTAEEADTMRRDLGWCLVEDASRGWRRVVPSPVPRKVVEWEVIQKLTRDGVITIAVGGGGVPVTRQPDGQLHGVDAVIDKDRSSALLGRLVGADSLILITSVDRVYRNFGKPDQEALPTLTAETAGRLLAAGEFPPGSMGPKIEAALGFLASGGSQVHITEPDSLLAALDGEAGTCIVPRGD